MSKLTKKEQENNDIDWYCSINGHSVHIASMGGLIPKQFCERAPLRELEETVIKLPYISEVELNEDVVTQEAKVGYGYIDRYDLSKYIEEKLAEFPSFNYNPNWNLSTRLFTYSFVDKARKGFYSYARIGNSYVLIASPKVECKEIELTPLGLNIKGIPVQFKL